MRGLVHRALLLHWQSLPYFLKFATFLADSGLPTGFGNTRDRKKNKVPIERRPVLSLAAWLRFSSLIAKTKIPSMRSCHRCGRDCCTRDWSKPQRGAGSTSALRDIESSPHPGPTQPSYSEVGSCNSHPGSGSRGGADRSASYRNPPASEPRLFGSLCRLPAPNVAFEDSFLHTSIVRGGTRITDSPVSLSETSRYGKAM